MKSLEEAITKIVYDNRNMVWRKDSNWIYAIASDLVAAGFIHKDQVEICDNCNGRGCFVFRDKDGCFRNKEDCSICSGRGWKIKEVK